MRMTTIAPGACALALLMTPTVCWAQASANSVPVMLPDDSFERMFSSSPSPEATGLAEGPVAEVDGGAHAGHEPGAAAAVVEPEAAATDPAVDAAPVAAATERLPLPPIESRSLGTVNEEATTSLDATDPAGWVRTGIALAGVLGLLLVLRWVLVRAGRRTGLTGALGAGGRAPSGVLSVLARYPVARGRSLVLLQLDSRVLLLDQSSEGFRTLSEITDEAEVASILMKTRDEEGASQAARFNGMLREMENDPRMLGDEYTEDELSARVRRFREMDA